MHQLNLLDGGSPDDECLRDTGGHSYTRADLDSLSTQVRAFLGDGRKSLVFCRGTRNVETLAWLLGALAGGHAMALLPPDGPTGDEESLSAYRPEYVVDAVGDGRCPPGYRAIGRLMASTLFSRTAPAEDDRPPHPETALLLATSGSLATPKMVRLSYRNLYSNATAIVEALSLGPGDRGITSLPITYSYGLSVVTSHLVAGAGLVVCAASPTSRYFWSQVRHHGVTDFAGVPVTYEILRSGRKPFTPPPTMRLMTSAGGRLERGHVEYFAQLAARHGAEFAVMYGQTEATARISCHRGAGVLARPDSVGTPVGTGSISIQDESGAPLPEGQVGEIVLSGPSVMLGYARSRMDLADGSRTGGVLPTGDLGHVRDGLLYVSGRLRRIAKPFGVRVSLDEVESLLRPSGSVAVVEDGRGNLLAAVEGAPAAFEEHRSRVLRTLRLPPEALVLCPVDRIPVTGSGKVDYAAVAAQVAARGESAWPRP
ncbi:AMP-binding protein [Streptomyces ossamyceticus]|uniref:AMP-binding protein n=1 Tax=Streptomyces ossamyceticus TaxID=249581 RepID=UPI0006E171B7|nr:AMP-binding protein [Streptomyces ossamyceticus]